MATPEKKKQKEKPSTTLQVELAKSNRSSCNGCKEKIDKDTTRMGLTTMKKDVPQLRWFHLKCWKLPKKGVDGGAEAIDGYGELDVVDKKWIDDTLLGINKAVPKKRPLETDARDDEDEDTKPNKKKSKKGEPEEEAPDASVIQKKYGKMTSTDLKTVLKNNLQGGFSALKKEDLVVKCVDGETYGALPRCPKCKKSTVQMSSDKEGFEVFTCPGYWDSNRKLRATCAFREQRCERITPWRQLSDTPRPDEYENAAPAVKADLGAFTGLGTKEACAMLVELAHARKLSLPKNDTRTANVESGTALMSTKAEDGGWQPEEALKILAEKFPKIEEDTVACAVPENQGLCDALEELAKFEMKENAFKGRSIVKAVDALRELSFAITSGKALAAGKEKVAGVGKGIAERIDEYLQAGNLKILEEFRAQKG